MLYPGDPGYWYRHISKGGWPFSTADNGWTVSDCTAEGLKASIYILEKIIDPLLLNMMIDIDVHKFLYQAVLMLSKLPSGTVGEPLGVKRLYDAVNVILSTGSYDPWF